MAYASVTDVQARLTKTLTVSEQALCNVLLSDAAVLIDAYGSTAADSVKAVVSCRMVARVLGDGVADVPAGATTGSMSALGYSQSWTMGNGSVGELYMSKTEKKMLGIANQIGSYSPVQELVPEVTAE